MIKTLKYLKTVLKWITELIEEGKKYKIECDYQTGKSLIFKISNMKKCTVIKIF